MKKILKNKKTAFICLFVIMLISHLLFKVNWGDDVWFKDAASNGIFEYVADRYSIWGSRLIIESVMILLLQLPNIVWCILDSFIIVLLAYSISYIFTNRKHDLIVCLLVCIYPLNLINSAGWYATTLNYLWPLALGIFSLIPLKNLFDEKKERWYMYPMYILSILYACNQEQMCAIILTFYSIFIIYRIVKKRNISSLVLIQCGLAIASMIFILTCPGNNSRTISETETWYPEFKDFGIFSKAYLGIVSTYAISMFYYTVPLILFVITLPVSIFKKYKNFFYRIISFVPLLLIIFVNYGIDIISKIYSGFMNSQFTNIIEKLKTYTVNADKIDICWSNIFILFLAIIFFGTIIYCLYLLFKKEKKNYLLLIYLAGLASRFIMGLSPTIYASGLRTFVFLDFSVIIMTLILIINDKKINKYLYVFIVILSILQIFNTILLVS